MPEEIAVSKKRTFAEIADDLSAYQESLEMEEARCLADWDHKKDTAEIRVHLERIGKELAGKTDDCAGVLRRFDSDIAEIGAEIKRLTAKRKSAEKASDWLRQYILSTMKQTGLQRLKTAKNSISIVKNGGKQALTIPHPELVPAELCDALIKMPMTMWLQLNDILDACYIIAAKSERIPNNEAIRAELEKNCLDCNGQGNYVPTGVAEWIECLKCQGTGKRKVPGCRLEERGSRLDVR